MHPVLVPQSHHCRGREGSPKVLRNRMEPENHPDTNSIGGGNPGMCVWEGEAPLLSWRQERMMDCRGVLGKEGEKSSFSDSAS